MDGRVMLESCYAEFNSSQGQLCGPPVCFSNLIIQGLTTECEAFRVKGTGEVQMTLLSSRKPLTMVLTCAPPPQVA